MDRSTWIDPLIYSDYILKPSPVDSWSGVWNNQRMNCPYRIHPRFYTEPHSADMINKAPTNITHYWVSIFWFKELTDTQATVVTHDNFCITYGLNNRQTRKNVAIIQSWGSSDVINHESVVWVIYVVTGTLRWNCNWGQKNQCINWSWAETSPKIQTIILLKYEKVWLTSPFSSIQCISALPNFVMHRKQKCQDIKGVVLVVFNCEI